MRQRRLALLAAPVAATVLVGCGAKLDPKSGEILIRQVAAKDNLGTIRSVSCPSGLDPKQGTAFDCKVKLTTPDGRNESGTITVHIVPGNRVAILGRQDLHLQ